jgi:hypothetical protein
VLSGNGDSNSANHPLTFAVDSSAVRPQDQLTRLVDNQVDLSRLQVGERPQCSGPTDVAGQRRSHAGEPRAAGGTDPRDDPSRHAARRCRSGPVRTRAGEPAVQRDPVPASRFPGRRDRQRARRPGGTARHRPGARRFPTTRTGSSPPSSGRAARAPHPVPASASRYPAAWPRRCRKNSHQKTTRRRAHHDHVAARGGLSIRTDGSGCVIPGLAPGSSTRAEIAHGPGMRPAHRALAAVRDSIMDACSVGPAGWPDHGVCSSYSRDPHLPPIWRQPGGAVFSYLFRTGLSVRSTVEIRAAAVHAQALLCAFAGGPYL